MPEVIKDIKTTKFTNALTQLLQSEENSVNFDIDLKTERPDSKMKVLGELTMEIVDMQNQL